MTAGSPEISTTDEVVARDRAQAGGVGGIRLRSPVPGARRPVQEAGFFEESTQLSGIVRAELFALPDGQLEGRALQVSE